MKLAQLTEKEKEELRRLAASASLREDCRILSDSSRALLLGTDGKPDHDKYMRFVSEFNAMIGHKRRPFRRIADHNMKL